MRKKFLRIFGCIALLAVALTGCGEGNEVKNNSQELIFNGGSVAQVGDYLYYANAYTPLDGATTEFDYAGKASLSYLNRADLSKGFANKIESPKSTKNISTKVTGHENTYMFVLGNYIYYTAPNERETTKPIQHAYNLVTLWRSPLNGGNAQELYFTDQYNNDTAQMRVLKGGDNAYYWIVYDGTDITGIKIGDQLGAKTVYAENVLSVAMPHENDSYSVKNVLYTQAQSEGSSSVYVYSLDYATNKSEKASNNESDLKFVGREGDTVFYTASSKTTESATYSKTLSSGSELELTVSSQSFHDTANVTEVYKAYNGYVYISGNVFYKADDLDKPITLLKPDSFTKILGVNGDWVYYTSGSTVKMLSVRNARTLGSIEQIDVVTMSSEITGCTSIATMQSGNSSADYLYFYSNLEKASEDDDKTYEETTNNYLYRVKLAPNQNYQILSNFTRTEIKE